MRVIRASDVSDACPMADAIGAVRAGFVALSAGRAAVPVRLGVPLGPGAVALTMPASLAGSPYYSVKVVTVVPDNPPRGLPLVGAAVLLGDAATGATLALIDGTTLTALRTGAAGGVAAAALARPESAVLALFGVGAQARTQLLAAAHVLSVREVRVVGRTPANVAAFLVWASEQPSLRATLVRAAVAEDAVAGADVVVTATGSATPVFPGRLLALGTHVTAIGSFTPAMRELDEDALRGARVVVDERRAALAEAGELVGRSGDDVVEIGEVLAGRVPGRRDRSDRTVFKSVGNAVQDLVVAARVYELAVQRGLGEEVRFP